MRFRFPSLAECAVLLLVLTLSVALYVLSHHEQLAEKMTVNRTLENAELLGEFAKTAHAQYADSIRSAVRSGTQPTMKPQPPAGMVHFPSTFLRHLSERYSKTHTGTSFRIYSDDPFQSTMAYDLDDFGLKALAALRSADRPSFWRMDQNAEGLEILRYAMPIVMTESCIDCHNRPQWNLNRPDWHVGDVRGVWEVSILVPDGSMNTASERAILTTLIILSGALGLFVVYPVVRREVLQRTHFERLSDSLSVLAETDPLSGLANRRAFEDALDAAAKSSTAGIDALGLIILDIDHFKSVNDTYGHDMGDVVISGIGATLKKHLRPGDIAARIGGEEFAIICPKVDLTELTRISERIRMTIEGQSFATGDDGISVTASVGAAMLEPEDDNRSFFRRADQLLFRAKQTGRNMVCVAG